LLEELHLEGLVDLGLHVIEHPATVEWPLDLQAVHLNGDRIPQHPPHQRLSEVVELREAPAVEQPADLLLHQVGRELGADLP
jgi:hypothetical protein